MPSIVDQSLDASTKTPDAEFLNHAVPDSDANSVVPRRSPFAQSIAVLILVWILGVGWLGIHMNRGWVPHDDGMLAQSAERVLHGQLPHRDFDEVYTGGLSYLHAAAFRMFGLNLMSLRITLLIFFAMWVPALYYCASRFAGAYAAGLATLLSVAWSVPNYPAAMPSWYNLFFATFGIAALLKYLEFRRTHWLFVAGLCGGFSFLMKSPGIYFVAAALIFFVFLEQSQSRGNSLRTVDGTGRSANLYRAFVTISVLTLVTALTLLVRQIVTLPRLYNFVLPGMALGLFLLGRESSPASAGSVTRFRNLFRMVLPFVAGCVVPVTILLIPYVASHSLRSIYEGIFVIPFQRLQIADYPPPKLGDLIALPPIVGLLTFAWYSKRRESRTVAAAVLALMILVMFIAPKDRIVYQFVWLSVFTLIPVVVGAGVLTLNRARSGGALTDLRRQQIFLILSALGMCSLIEFPYSSAMYFCYVAPLLALAMLALTTSRNPAPRLMPAMLALFLIAFMTVWVTPAMSLDNMAWAYTAPSPTQALTMPRAGGLRIASDDAELYERLLPFVKEKATNGVLYAGPDTPEIYFLGGYANPTRMIYDVFENYSGETERVVAAINAAQPNVVVINRIPTVSVPFPPELVDILNERYPQMQNFGKFQVRWRP